MKIVLLLALLSFSTILHAQSTFIVDDFSDRYFGKVFISQPTEVFSKGWIAIFDKKTKKQLIKIHADELTFELHDGHVISNIKNLPYGEQSSIMYEDFNFDGKKDLALMDGQNSCYHGPSFQIYLATKNGFSHNSAFTRLAQQYCGMFDADLQTKKIHTMTKSGCCWHQYSDFIVRDNTPLAVKIVEESLNPNSLGWDYVEYNRIGKKLVRKAYSIFDSKEQEQNVVFSFGFTNHKKMRLVDLGDVLQYVFTDKDDKVELMYSGPFFASKEKGLLWFTNGKIRYEISHDSIAVSTLKKKLDMKADPDSISGAFPELLAKKFENVTEQ